MNYNLTSLFSYLQKPGYYFIGGRWTKEYQSENPNLNAIGKLLALSPWQLSFRHQNLNFNTVTLDDLKKFLNQPIQYFDFESLLDHTISNLIDKWELSPNKVTLMWSGGLDSTALLYAIIDNSKFKQIENKFFILCSQNSINEYPRAYEELKKKLSFMVLDHNTFYERVAQQQLLEDCIFIQGDPAAHFLSGRDGVTDEEGDEPWEPIARKILGGLPLPPILQEIVTLFPGYIKTFQEFVWLLGILFRMDHYRNRLAVHLLHSTRSKSLKKGNYCSPLGTSAFQNFALGWVQRNGVQSGKLVKPYMRDYIFKHNGDPDFRATKTKVFSNIGFRDINYTTVCNLVRTEKGAIKFLLKEFQNYYTGDSTTKNKLLSFFIGNEMASLEENYEDI